MLDPERVAGRDTHQLLIQPRDDLRFGYRLFIDQLSSLPLRSVMFDDAQQIVSQTMFVDVLIGEAVTPIERDLSAMQVARADPSEKPSLERLAPTAWVFADLPPGFQLNVHRRRAMANAQGELEHFIFSDGLATVSVYVQPASGDGDWAGESRHGAAKAVGRSMGDHEVIAIGEVPPRTLHWFVEHIQAASH